MVFTLLKDYIPVSNKKEGKKYLELVASKRGAQGFIPNTKKCKNKIKKCTKETYVTCKA
jgi:hypothetical protein